MCWMNGGLNEKINLKAHCCHGYSSAWGGMHYTAYGVIAPYTHLWSCSLATAKMLWSLAPWPHWTFTLIPVFSTGCVAQQWSNCHLRTVRYLFSSVSNSMLSTLPLMPKISQMKKAVGKLFSIALPHPSILWFHCIHSELYQKTGSSPLLEVKQQSENPQED